MDEEITVTKEQLRGMQQSGEYDMAIVKSICEKWTGHKMQYIFILQDGTKVKI